MDIGHGQFIMHEESKVYFVWIEADYFSVNCFSPSF